MWRLQGRNEPRVFEERNESEEKWLGTQQDMALASYTSVADPLARPPPVPSCDKRPRCLFFSGAGS